MIILPYARLLDLVLLSIFFSSTVELDKLFRSILSCQFLPLSCALYSQLVHLLKITSKLYNSAVPKVKIWIKLRIHCLVYHLCMVSLKRDLVCNWNWPFLIRKILLWNLYLWVFSVSNPNRGRKKIYANLKTH